MSAPIDPDRPSRRRLIVAAVACTVSLLACGSCLVIELGSPFSIPPVVPESELAATMDSYATLTADAIGTPVDPQQRPSAQPCTDRDGSDNTRGNRYQLIGIYSLTAPEPTTEMAVARVHKEWQQRGYDVEQPIYTANGRFNDLYARDRDSRIGLALRATGIDNRLSLRIASPCVRAPAGEDPQMPGP